MPDSNELKTEVRCPCGVDVPHCHCELIGGAHRHVSQDEQEPAENDVPLVHHVHDNDISGAAQKAG